MVSSGNVSAGMVPASSDLEAPTVHVWLKNIPEVYLIFLIVGFSLTIFTFLVAIWQVRRVHKFVRDENVQLDVYWVVVYPFIISLLCSISNLAPRSAIVLYAFSYTLMLLTYLAVFTGTLKALGGVERVVQYILSSNKQIVLNTKPMCCCCACLPSCRPTKRNISRLLKIIAVVSVIRIVLLMALLVVEIDGESYRSMSLQAVCGVADTLVVFSLYVTQIQYAALYDRMRTLGFNVLFQIVDGTMPFFLLGKAILEMLARFGVLKDTQMLPALSVAYFWFNAGMPFIMTIASMAGLVCL